MVRGRRPGPPGGPGGRVLVVGRPGACARSQALVRWDPLGYAERELAERRDLRPAPGGSGGSADRARPCRPASWSSRWRAELGPIGPAPVGPAARRGRLGDLAAGRLDRRRRPPGAAPCTAAQAIRSARQAPVVSARLDPVTLR